MAVASRVGLAFFFRLGQPVRAADRVPPATYGHSIDVVTRALELDLVDPCSGRVGKLPAGRIEGVGVGSHRFGGA